MKPFLPVALALQALFPSTQAGERDVMIQSHLKDRGIRSEAVIRAMLQTPREEFVPGEYRKHAYEDGPLPIGYGQTISQPYIVALMTELLEPKPGHRILEVGTGSGYQAAVLSGLVRDVYTIEIVTPLAERAKEVLSRLGFKNVHVRAGDGYLGWPEEAPFDAIIVTCAPEAVPEPLVKQLAEGGRLVIPIGERGGVQKLIRMTKTKGKLHEEEVLDVRFVPLTRPGERTD